VTAPIATRDDARAISFASPRFVLGPLDLPADSRAVRARVQA
jgi:hypothetical protein